MQASILYRNVRVSLELHNSREFLRVSESAYFPEVKKQMVGGKLPDGQTSSLAIVSIGSVL